MHYEGADCYGDNIEVTDWREYDIKARRPDVIVTFSPYDAGNYVTSIHPNFYCERLREFTDLLIYIPYFVAVGDVQEHFCTVAGCVFAHKVVLQSDKIRDTYIRVFKRWYGGRFGKPEDKFVALGSPKYDKIINTQRDDCQLPDVWRKLIGDKKVVFYNTSVGAMLAGNEQYLKKLRYVLDTFHKRCDIVLWWRPHPLSEETFSSMRPQLFPEYEQIIADYRHGGWGIYDDTPDLHRAIVMSDAYYGDASSIFALYDITGKPIMTQNVAAIQERCEEHVTLGEQQLEKLEPLRKLSYLEKTKHYNTAMSCIFNESYIADLNSYLDHIVEDYDTDEAKALHDKQANPFKQVTAYPYGTAGQVIYNFFRKSILG